MKRLYLIRHAKSSWDSPQLDDYDRPLNQRGFKAAPFMGARLKKYNVSPGLIISSPAKRAKTTAEIIAKEIGYPIKDIVLNKKIYEASLNDLINVISDVDDKYEDIIIFGHNPTFTQAANFLSNSQVPNMPTASIFCIDFDMEHWQNISENTGRFVFFDYPKKHDPHL